MTAALHSASDNVAPPDLAARALPDELARQAGIIAGQELFVSFINLVPLPVLILNEYRQTLFMNAAARALVNIHQKPDVEIIGMRPGEILSCNLVRMSTGGCGTSDGCCLCGAFMSLFNTIYLDRPDERECRILKTGTSEALDLKVWTHPYVIAGERFTFVTLADISADKRRSVLEKVFFHDVLNTAGALRGSSRMLRDAVASGQSPEEYVDLIAILNRSSDSLIRDIQQQRGLVAAENNELSVSFDCVSCAVFLRNIAGVYSNHECAAGRTILVDNCDESLSFTSDESLLFRIVGNMLKNALEAIPAGGTVHISCCDDGDHVVFAVQNPGVIPHDVQLQIFHRSYSTKGKGRGIGTYSMKLLGERYLEGSVSFVSDANVGTVFSARFPKKI